MSLVPELYVTNLSQSLQFYVDLLGFKINYKRPENNFVAISLEKGKLMLQEFISSNKASKEEFQQGHWQTDRLEYPLGRGINFEFTITNLESAYLELKKAKYPITVDLHNKKYRVENQLIEVKQFLVMDPDGYLIRLAQELAFVTVKA